VDDLAFTTGLLLHNARQAQTRIQSIEASLAEKVLDLARVDSKDRTQKFRSQCLQVCETLTQADQILVAALRPFKSQCHTREMMFYR
jgi:hypothetical protein